MIKGSIQQEDIILVNIYTTDVGVPKYVKQILMGIKREISSNSVIVGDFNTPLTSMNRSSRIKINKETTALNDTLDQMDLTGISEHFAPKLLNIPHLQVHMEHFLE